MPRPARQYMDRFDESDRRKVISEVEKHFETSLRPVQRYRKFLEDLRGNSYWVLGGYGDWHGFKGAMLEEQKGRPCDGVLVVAMRLAGRIDIFTGSLQKLVDNTKDLSHTQEGDYQFHISVHGDSLSIKEILGSYLRRLVALPLAT